MTLVLTSAAPTAATESVPKYGESAPTDVDDMLKPARRNARALRGCAERVARAHARSMRYA
jgi:hypothetical protein